MLSKFGSGSVVQMWSPVDGEEEGICYLYIVNITTVLQCLMFTAEF